MGHVSTRPDPADTTCSKSQGHPEGAKEERPTWEAKDIPPPHSQRRK
jgi:hypothetical protein